MSSTALEIRHLETLLALSECGSLSKAAARLFLTQSALSHQLKALESHYGAALVEKNVRPLRFTAIGQTIIEPGAGGSAANGRGRPRCRALGAGTCGPVACGRAMPQLLRLVDAGDGCLPDPVARSGAGHHFRVSHESAAAARSTARRNLPSFTIAQEAHPSMVFSPLFRYESVALMSPRHRLAAQALGGRRGLRGRNPHHLSGAG